MATRLLSFLQLCTEADPDFMDDLNWPVQYEFDNGRYFLRPQPVYPTVSDIGDFGIGISPIEGGA